MSVKFFKTGLGLDPVSSDPSNPKEGQLQFSDGTARAQGVWQYKNGAWSSVGSGGGGLDVFFTDDFETTKAASVVSGKDAVFDNGGSLGGALADETVLNISSDTSLKYTTNATPGSSDNDFFYLPTITLDEKQQGTDIGLTFYYKWDGSDDLIQVIIFDDTGNVVLTSNLDLLKNATGATRYSTSVFVPDSTTTLKVGFHHTGASEASKVLIVDDFELSTNPFVSKNIIETQTSFVSNTTSFTNTVIKGTISSSSGGGIYSYDSVTGIYTVLKKSQITISASLSSASGGSFIGTEIKKTDISGTVVIAIDADSSGTGYANASVTDTFETGDTFIVSNNTGNATDNNKIKVHAIAESDHIITPAKSNFNTFGARIANNGTASIISQTGDFIASVNRSAQGRVDVTFKTGLFTVAPSVIAIVDNQAFATGQVNDAVFNISTTGCSVTTENSGFVDSDFNFCLMVTRQGTDVLNASFEAAIPVPKTAYIKDVKSSGTDGGTFTSGSWQTRDLNTVEGNSEIVTLSANQFTLSAGEYRVKGSAPNYAGEEHKTKIRNITDSTDDIIGTSEFNTASGTVQNRSFVDGVLVLTEPKTFELQHRCVSSTGTDGFGFASNLGVDEVYSVLEITKLR